MTKPLGQLSQSEKSDKKESKIIWSKKEKEESKKNMVVRSWLKMDH